MANNNFYPIQIKKRVILELSANLFYLLLFFVLFNYFYISSSVNGKGIAFLTIKYTPFLVLLIILLIRTLWDIIYLRSYRFECKKNEFFFSGGIVSRFEKNLPYSKIQHVIIYETFLQRILGIASVSIETARESGGGLTIPDLLKGDAIKLKDYIVSLSGKYKPIAGI